MSVSSVRSSGREACCHSHFVTHILKPAHPAVGVLTLTVVGTRIHPVVGIAIIGRRTRASSIVTSLWATLAGREET